MAETIYVRGEGGAVIAMDLPLPEGIAERYERGQLRRVNPDGSPYQGSPTPLAPAAAPATPGGTDSEPPAAPAAAGDRPAVNAPKADWIAYVVRAGRLSAEDAANYTKADLIDLVS